MKTRLLAELHSYKEMNKQLMRENNNLRLALYSLTILILLVLVGAAGWTW